MASFKELSMSRPLPQTGLPVRQNHHPRHHSHSISLGAANSNHRVTRRKSVTITAAANAAAAAVATLKDESGAIPMASSQRRTFANRKGLESTSLGAPSALAAGSSFLSRSLNNQSPEHDHYNHYNHHHHHHQQQHQQQQPRTAAASAAAAAATVDRRPSPNSDVASTLIDDSGKLISTKNRNRRASEGSPLIKSDGKRTIPELRCDRCGKGYKHGSCLSKHMWEHDPAWAITSKLLISKHQQVQLLEAATVLVNMNIDPVSAEESLEADSETSSPSPGASSEIRDGLSSTETTPPPMEEADEDQADWDMSGVPAAGPKRFSVSNISGYSRSYQSIPSSSFNGSAPLHSPAFSSHFRQSSIDTRPSTADTKLPDEDEADLAAAIGLCNFGTPRTGPVPMSPDVPPVPPLPARFLDSQGSRHSSLDHSATAAAASMDNGLSSPFMGSATTPNIFGVSFNPSLSYKVSDEREVRMGDGDRESRHRRNNDVDFGSRPTVSVDDDDDGVFGRMEE
ncbi:hypothetical protein ASPZODRAFT_138438 [Penicilliopsis zonata CBS 506.65]|uniref:C2H2-type domain-containing protein n=1 Tax=Penicilliopsis zonata CBS 506.65 TaxID=1073090 RepID=A0A1L9SVV2_9EURO|nr:hypothetical protein ASPZODRAFT_138438 [Penicilliopsis zonata CBS 506.65]OJJ51335.1 hypothetical protein ASPZODRAFT_138438 [Penicilliopsis zonata CBS 506.65]